VATDPAPSLAVVAVDLALSSTVAGNPTPPWRWRGIEPLLGFNGSGLFLLLFGDRSSPLLFCDGAPALLQAPGARRLRT